VGAAYARAQHETPHGAGAGGDRQAEQRRWPRWPVFAGIALVMVIAGVAGYGAADFLKQRQQWQRTTASDVDNAGADLSLAVASMRKVSYEVTPKDLTTWLQHPHGYGSPVGLRVLSSDGDTVQVAGYRTWRDHIVKRNHTTRSCASIELKPGIQDPVTTTTTACPDTAPKTAPAPASGKGGELAGPVEKARTHREKGSATGLLAIAPPTKPVGDLHNESVSLMCAPGTTDIGTNDGYINGKKIPIRLCSVDDLPSTSETSTPGNRFFIKGASGHAVFNARVSGAIVALIKEAKADGLDLSANSSFRTMAQQQDTCDHDLSKGCPKGDYTLVAQPGYSNHQAGAAVDFKGTAVPGKDSCTAGRAKDPSSKVWQFLNKHALEFGFRQYAPESWHWDVMTDPDRCNPL
ncbi:MAG: D-alanyl-D-alanine carboxypeptidase family protein, partial [Nocardioides sp.]|nr:D-alanyl-D-alanine carboxypeptidase family protein [Nocardioides sp.]